MKIKDKEFVTYISEEVISRKVKELASQINEDYQYLNPIFIAVLNGSFMFAADLFKNLDMAAEIIFIKVASYEQLSSTGNVNSLIGLTEPLHDRNVVIIEDIIDTGFTMKKIMEMLEDLGPKTIEIVTLLYKPEALQVDLNIKYCGFEIQNKFVVGYGLDYDGLGRNFREILQLKD